MKLCASPSLSFKGNIIDSHSHVGEFVGGQKPSVGQLNQIAKDTFEISVNGQKQNDEVECFLVSNLECMYEHEQGKFLKDEIVGNKELLELCKQNSKLKAELVCEPRNGNAQNIDQLLQEHKEDIYALKFHPQCSKIDADNAKYEPYMKVAQAHKQPCVFHSDKVGSFSCPQKIYDLAKKTPDVPVVLYHMSMASGAKVKDDISADQIKAKGLEQVAATNYTGAEDYKNYIWEYREKWNQDGIDVVKESIAKKDANLYLEISWTKPETVVKAIKEVGADRVLFGTDAALGDMGQVEPYRNRVADVKTAIKQNFDNADEVIDKVFFENANKLFFGGKLKQSVGGVLKSIVGAPSEIKEIIDQKPPVEKSNKKLWWLAGGVAVALAGAAFLLGNTKPQSAKANKA